MTLDYKDENGNILKGFSQIDLEKLDKRIKKNNTLLKLLVVILSGFLMVIVWILWQLKKYHFLTWLVQNIR